MAQRKGAYQATCAFAAGLKVAAWLVLAVACTACARDAPTATSGFDARAEKAFEAARERCGITVAETPAVQRCMRAQGWAYRLPWQ